MLCINYAEKTGDCVVDTAAFLNTDNRLLDSVLKCVGVGRKGVM
jgi:hypothetical protein